VFRVEQSNNHTLSELDLFTYFECYPNPEHAKQTHIHSGKFKFKSVSKIGYLVHTHDSSCLESKDRKSFNYSNKNEKLMLLVELRVRCHSKKVSRYDAISR
jgi:hypothetical protein